MRNYQHVIESFTLITSSKGMFRFTVDGRVLFSKKEIGRHAEPGEILNHIQKNIGRAVAPNPQAS